MLKNILGKLSKNIKDEEVFAYTSGKIVKIEKVPDPIFSEKMMGEGIAIMPSDGKVVAPIDGEIIMIAETKHAFALRTALGEEILIHIGLETVELKGEGFTSFVKVGDKVTRGQSIIEADLEYIEKNANSKLIILVITNSLEGKYNFEWENTQEVKVGETKLFSTCLK